MKRTVTEILIEVEETVEVRMTEKSSNAESELKHLKDKRSTCPLCGQTIKKTKELEVRRTK